jgi:hypothetical protein
VPLERITLFCQPIVFWKSKSLPPTGFRWMGSVFQALLAICLLSAAARAADSPFDMSSNWGGTGLMEIPTARILPDGAMRLGVAKASPYVWYAFGFGLLPGLEFSGRYTDVTNLPSGLSPDFGSYKDKAFDVKYQIFRESKRGPAIALGVNDFQGTRLFESQYLVLSRQLYPLDVTLGVGRKRFKGPLSIGDEIGFWGGIEWALTDRLHLMLEYNPIEYQKDPEPCRGVPEGSDSPFNAGLRYRTWLGFDLGLSYQRGNTIAMAVQLQFKLGRPILPPRPDPPSWQFAAGKPAAHESSDQKLQQLTNAIEQAGFIDVATAITNGELIAEFENNKYLSDARAAGRVLRLLMLQADSGTERLTVVMKRMGLKILYISAAAKDARAYLLGGMAPDQFAQRLSVTAQYPPENRSAPSAAAISSAARRQGARRPLTYGINPVLESFFNDPSGVYHSRLVLKPYATLKLWPGCAIHGSYDFPIYSDIESTNSPLPNAVRSDAWRYLGSQSAVDRLLIDQVMKLSALTYARISAGCLERMYSGVGGEVLTFMGQGQWAAGLEGDWVRKREPDDAWALTDQQNHTILGNLYYHYLPLDVTLKAQAGRFLAGDTGARLEFRRRFDTGAEIGFWYSFTDTSNLTDFNRDYHDQGIFMNLPFATFTDRPTRKMLHFRISPWTRDVGAAIDHWQEIYDNSVDLTPASWRQGMGRLAD